MAAVALPSATCVAVRAMVEPTRARILGIIAERTHLCRELEDFVGIHVSDIVEELDIPQPQVSKHLAKLRATGLVTVHRRGQWGYYLRDENRINQIKAQIQVI